MNLCQIVCHTGLLAALVMPAFAVQAMEQLDDFQMAASTGQDGISIGIQLPNSTFSFDQISLVNVDDRSNPASGRASLVIAPANVSPTQGIRFFTSTGVPTSQPFTVEIDADGNGVTPTLNINVGLPTDLARIRINPFSMYLADGSGNIFTNRTTNGVGANTLRVGVTEVLRVGTGGVDIRFKANDPIGFNIQLGDEPQGHMLMVTGGTFLQLVSNSPIELMSLNTGGTTQSSLRFNLDVSATDQVSGFQLNGLYANFDAGGLAIGKDGLTDKLNIQVNDVTAGTAGSIAPTVFNGTANGTLGNFGVQGLQIQNLRVNVSGM